MAKKNDRKQFVVEIEPELYEKFKKVSDEKGITRTKWLRSKIQEFVENK